MAEGFGGGGGGRGRGGPKGAGDKGPRRGGSGGGGMFRRRRICKFKSEKIDYIDYKDVRLLLQFIPERGKLQLAIKRARELALIPYVTD